MFPLTGQGPRGWRGLGLTGSRCWCLAFTCLCSWARLFCPRPRWQTPVPNSHLLRSNLQAPPQPTAFIQTTPALPALRPLVASLHLPSVFSPFLFTCAHQPGSLPCVLTFVSVRLPLPVGWPSLPHLLLFADPSLKACFQTASYTKLL